MSKEPSDKQFEESTEKNQGKERLLQAFEIYNNLTEKKLEDFIEVKSYLIKTLEDLFQDGKIGSGVTLLSRVKSPESVVENWKLGKDLYDIFGTTILTTNQDEMDEIRKVLRKEKRFSMTSKKEMNEKRGYEALHFLFLAGHENKETKIECHMQTHENYRNVYPHIFYKVRRQLKRDLTQEEEMQIDKKIQEMYESGELSGYDISGGRKSRLPQMWLASFNQQGKMEEQELDERMILKIMYPSLDISKNIKRVSNTPKIQSPIIEEETEQEEIEI